MHVNVLNIVMWIKKRNWIVNSPGRRGETCTAHIHTRIHNIFAIFRLCTTFQKHQIVISMEFHLATRSLYIGVSAQIQNCIANGPQTIIRIIVAFFFIVAVYIRYWTLQARPNIFFVSKIVVYIFWNCAWYNRNLAKFFFCCYSLFKWIRMVALCTYMPM